jgi:hypothetical protein
MTFFLNNPTPENGEPETRDRGKADDQAVASPYSGKSQPLFKQGNSLPDTLPGQHISLSAYISKHLQDNDTEPETPDNQPAAPTHFRAFPKPERQALQNNQAGQYLNSLDVDMASGLEQYLPSPLFRLRIAKKRLDTEITELRQRLNKYERLPEKSLALQERILGLRSKLHALELHQRQVNRELSANLTLLGPALYFISKQGRALQTFWDQVLGQIRKGLLSVFYGGAYLEMQANGDEMFYLKELYAERLKDRSSADSELSAIINRFEQVVQRTEKDAGKLKPISFPMRLWQDVKRLVK